jgi:hypothetical protein
MFYLKLPSVHLPAEVTNMGRHVARGLADVSILKQYERREISKLEFDSKVTNTEGIACDKGMGSLW